MHMRWATGSRAGRIAFRNSRTHIKTHMTDFVFKGLLVAQGATWEREGGDWESAYGPLHPRATRHFTSRQFGPLGLAFMVRTQPAQPAEAAARPLRG